MADDSTAEPSDPPRPDNDPGADDDPGADNDRGADEELETDEDLDEIYRATADKRRKQSYRLGAYGLGSLVLSLATFLASGRVFAAEGLSENAIWIVGYGALLFGVLLTSFAVALFINASKLSSRH